MSDVEPTGPAATEWSEPTLDALSSPYHTAVDVIAELRRRDRFLFRVAVINLALALLFTALMQVDGRMLLGRNVWTKPWKFATSITIFTATMGWLLPTLSPTDRVKRRASQIIGGSMLIEITLISGQAARAVPSHFNTSTLTDSLIFGVMGTTITVNTLVVAYLLWRVSRTRPSLRPSYLWGIRIGMLVFVVASFEGWLMVARGSHAVGVEAGGPGLPLINWSLTGGDLRIAHFVGLHALQVLPLTGYAAARWDRLSTRGALGVVGAASGLYALLVAATFALAMLGHPPVSSLPSISTVFGASFLLVAPFWAVMILAPGWNWTRRLLDSHLVIAPAAALYLLFVVPHIGDVAGVVLQPSLSELTGLLATEAGATIAWVHFLAFDLFVGRWIYCDADERDAPTLVVSPILVLTLLFGPTGFLTYVAVRPILGSTS